MLYFYVVLGVVLSVVLGVFLGIVFGIALGVILDINIDFFLVVHGVFQPLESMSIIWYRTHWR